MKSTFEIMEATAKVFYRFGSELPEKYMQEIFGKDDPVLAEKCLQYPKCGSGALLHLLYSLKYDEREALVRYINKKDR
jgi:hypothetical protein